MASNIKGINFEIGGDTKPLQKALKDVTKGATETTKELRQIDKALKFDPGNVTLLAQKQELLGKQVNTTKEKLETLRKAQEQVDKQFEKGEIGADQYRAFQREVETTKGILGSYENKLESVTKQLNGNASAVEENAQTMKGLQAETNNLLRADLLNDFSDKIGQASEKLVELGESALEAFRTVDEGMDTIVTKTGASGKALEEMQGIASDLATSIPTDFSTAGAAVGEVNTQFQLTGEQLKNTSSDLIKFSEINGTDVTNSTILSKKAVEAYGLTVNDLSSVLDSTTYIAQLTGVSVDDLMKKAVDGAPQIKSLGLSFDEGANLIATFEKAGVDSSAALSSLSKAAVNYAKDGKTLQQGLTETVSAIKNSTSETEALTIASNVFGSKAAPRMVDAINRGAFSFENLAGIAEDAAGVVGSTYEATLDPIDNFTVAQNKTTESMADLGGIIAEVLAPILMTLADILKVVADFFNSMPGPIKQAVVIFGLLVVAIGAILPVILALVAAAKAFETTVIAMISAAAPIIGIAIAIAAAIALLVAGIMWLWDTNEGFRNTVMAVWQAIYDTIANIVQQVSDFVMDVFGVLVTWWNENQELILQTADTVWNAIMTVINVVMGIIGPLLSAAWSNIQIVITTVWDIIKQVVMTAINYVLGIIKAVMQVLNGDWSGAWETIKSTLSSTFDSMKSIVSRVLSSISDIVSNVWNGIKKTISNAINGAKEAVSTAIEAIKGFFNFEFKWPRIPLPRFKISGSTNPLDWLKQGLPKIDIDFFAKGGIMTKPTAFGMSGNRMLVGGEAGNEAILPLNKHYLSQIGYAIAESSGLSNGNIEMLLTTLVSLTQSLVDKDQTIVLNGRNMAREMRGEMAKELKKESELEQILEGGMPW